ncbi:MAG: PIN domain-containing protein [Anaerolineales bacterium]|nr:PIN domain-containing protein [Anaerolineales bacterium]MCX7754822.1 PIN domain-containing protein [Anaerolineales bacterium]MDW8277804.1 PIN domain-containing protein [Anaerolineales bacterium]
MSKLQIVADTNVFVTALRSQWGAAYQFFARIDAGYYQLNFSVPLALEYEDAAKRLIGQIPLSEQEIDDILDYVISQSNRWQVHYLWRPQLRDPGDDMVLELAVTAGCSHIITYNTRDFAGIESFGIQVLTPKDFLKLAGAR